VPDRSGNAPVHPIPMSVVLSVPGLLQQFAKGCARSELQVEIPNSEFRIRNRRVG
jgi:hypothetical protein